jgi:hypothetical protein
MWQYPQIAHLCEAASKIVVLSLHGGEEENLTQRRKGAKMKTRIGIAAKRHKKHRKDEPQPRTRKAFGGTVSGVKWTQIYADKQINSQQGHKGTVPLTFHPSSLCVFA